MKKLLATCVALCTIFFIESKADYHVTELQLENSYTLTTNVNLYTIWLTNTSLHLNSTDKNLKLCTIPIDPSKDFTIDRIQAKALTNGQRFVVWGVRDYNAWLKLSGGGGLESNYMVLVVDPWNCNYKSVQIPTYEREYRDKKKWYSYGDALVIANVDNFDVFLPGHRSCSPCRFIVEGEKIELEHQLPFSNPKLVSYVSQKPLHIHPFHPIDRKHGYFFAHNFENETAVIRHLDEQFKTLKQLYIDHPVHSVSIWPAKDPLLSICYTSHNFDPVDDSKHSEVFCQQLDSEFQPKLTFRLPVPENNFVSGMLHLSHQIDPLGNIYVGLVEASNRRIEGVENIEARQLRYFAYDKTGKLLESQDLDKVDSVVKKEDKMSYNHGLYSTLIAGNKFCIMSENYVGSNQEKYHEIITCFDVHKYYKQ